MTRPPALPDLILPAWRTNARVTADLVRALPAGVYRAPVPGLPRRTVRMMAAHLHNSRCGWLRTLGQPHDIPVPGRVNPAGEDKPALLRALRRWKERSWDGVAYNPSKAHKAWTSMPMASSFRRPRTSYRRTSGRAPTGAAFGPGSSRSFCCFPRGR